MNEAFDKLREDKKLNIINSGFEVFSKYGFQKSSTELIAVKAGISKGLLFYYFKNKISYFVYLFNYAQNIICSNIDIERCKEYTDFFELLEYVTKEKCKVLKKFPYILNFIVAAYCSNDERVKASIIEGRYKKNSRNIYDYFHNIQKDKFKENIDINEIIEMLSLMLDGYLQNKYQSKEEINVDEIMNKYRIWINILKQGVYK